MDCLASLLPVKHKFCIYHLSTPPTRCSPLFAPAIRSNPPRTFCESHLLLVAQSVDQGDGSISVPLFAIELLVYSIRKRTVVFVAKADSTGLFLRGEDTHKPALSISEVATEFIAQIIKKRQRKGRVLTVALFARAQDQYLFPGSAANPGKHQLDDRGLIKWWCRTLDPIIKGHNPLCESPSGQRDSIGSRGYLIVPGFDKAETRSFYPRNHEDATLTSSRWTCAYPVEYLADSASNFLIRTLIPRFPDDPKCRFADDLDDEIPDAASSDISGSPSKRGIGKWKSVKSVDQFWEMMAFRQECSSGRLVGFIWAVFAPGGEAPSGENENENDTEGAEKLISRDRESDRRLTSNISTTSINVSVTTAERQRETGKKRKVKLLTGSIIPRAPRIKKSATNDQLHLPPEDSPFYRWPQDSRGELVLSEKDYKRAHEILLRLEFRGTEAAKASLKKWADEISILANKPWGRMVDGRRPRTHDVPIIGHLRPASAKEGQLSVKGFGDTKTAGSGESFPPPTRSPEGVNVLSSTAVRKKKKVVPLLV